MPQTKTINPRRYAAILLLAIIAIYITMVYSFWNRAMTKTEIVVCIILGIFSVFELVTALRKREGPDR